MFVLPPLEARQQFSNDERFSLGANLVASVVIGYAVPGNVITNKWKKVGIVSACSVISFLALSMNNQSSYVNRVLATPLSFIASRIAAKFILPENDTLKLSEFAIIALYQISETNAIIAAKVQEKGFFLRDF